MRTRRARRSPLEATIRHAIPITTVARTLVDLAAEIGEDKLARACHEAGVRFGTTPAQVEAVLARHPNAKGVVTLRKVLRGEVQVVLSGLERSFLALVRDAHLPLPLTNRAAGGRRVDCPLAGAAADRRARQLQLPQQPLLLGAGPAPRTRSPRPRRPASPLYPRRRVRPPGFGRGGAATAARPVTGSRDTGGCPRRRGAPVSCAPSAVETPQSCPGAVESRPTSSPPRPWRRPREPLPPTRPRGACELSRVLPPGSVENPPTSFFPPRPGASLERAAPRPVRPRPMRCAPRAGAARRPGAPARPDGRLSSAR